ncbi:MerC domain-containing protein [Luminiphilus sp.]|nr:MerC domain-containing protein [Luminiphilus sp.]MDC0973685.1 MerC domain-containing protein [Luminiphilus sp.]
MKFSTEKNRPIADVSAVGLSSLCLVHCLMLPVVVSVYPATIAVTLSDEVFHLFMVLMAIPISVFALFFGCRSHKSYSVGLTGALSIGLLFMSAFLPHELAGETGERLLTVSGALSLSVSHVLNFRLCQSVKCCNTAGSTANQ